MWVNFASHILTKSCDHRNFEFAYHSDVRNQRALTLRGRYVGEWSHRSPRLSRVRIYADNPLAKPKVVKVQAAAFLTYAETLVWAV
jgi:hypothetical protein